MENENICEVCQKTEGAFHNHHIIPRANGGYYGPTVLLCNSCHEAIHHCANLDISMQEYNNLPETKHKLLFHHQVRKANALVSSIIISDMMTKGSKNKRIKLSFSLSMKDNERLTYWANINKMSKENVIREAIKRFIS